ncbi:MAG: HEAT repeat domain-containing protein [Porphyromonadaceae bacterium]|nr:HEAT repeat domain-containing protein [Porphyromonadaceae bacterium]
MKQAIRKGAVRIDLVPQDILARLNRGEIETVNLTEGLAIDQIALLKNTLISLDRESYITPILDAIAELPKATFNTLNHIIGQTIHRLISLHQDDDLWLGIVSHPSDTIRCWACYLVASRDMGIDEYLEQIRPFASDHHFGVREVSWLSMREHITSNLNRSLAILSEWVTDDNSYVRRFATESTRPRGVWCQHISQLKTDPSLAIHLLEPLKSDSSRYVQDSVANWLNDASKTAPEFVMTLTDRWRTESPTNETAYIIKRALRTLHKKK